MNTSHKNQHDFTIEWTGWPSVKKLRSAYCTEVRWAELAQEMRDPQPMPPEGKDGLNAWTMGVFRDGYRNRAAHLYATGIIIDYDWGTNLLIGVRGSINLVIAKVVVAGPGVLQGVGLRGPERARTHLTASGWPR